MPPKVEKATKDPEDLPDRSPRRHMHGLVLTTADFAVELRSDSVLWMRAWGR